MGLGDVSLVWASSLLSVLYVCAIDIPPPSSGPVLLPPVQTAPQVWVVSWVGVSFLLGGSTSGGNLPVLDPAGVFSYRLSLAWYLGLWCLQQVRTGAR